MLRILFCLSLLVLCSLVEAQTRYGLTLGYNLYNNRGGKVVSGNLYDYGWSYERQNITAPLRIGYQAGIALNFRSSKSFQVHSGLFYERISGANKYTYSKGGYPVQYYEVYDEKNSLGYVTIPLVMSLATQAGPGKLSVLLGPQFSFATGGSYNAVVKKYSYVSGFLSPGKYTPTVKSDVQGSYEVVDKADVSTSSNNNVRYYKFFNMALQMGAGYEYKNLFFKAYYTMGLTNTEPSYIDAGSTYKVLYSGFNFSTTWLFQLKTKNRFKFVRVKE